MKQTESFLAKHRYQKKIMQRLSGGLEFRVKMITWISMVSSRLRLSSLCPIINTVNHSDFRIRNRIKMKQSLKRSAKDLPTPIHRGGVSLANVYVSSRTIVRSVACRSVASSHRPRPAEQRFTDHHTLVFRVPCLVALWHLASRRLL